jgi:hypothetical protein
MGDMNAESVERDEILKLRKQLSIAIKALNTISSWPNDLIREHVREAIERIKSLEDKR